MQFVLPKSKLVIATSVTLAKRKQDTRSNLVRGRQCLGLVIAVLNNMIQNLRMGGKEVLAKDVAEVISRCGWARYWNLSEDSNGTGLAKAIGDCMGDHSNSLRLKSERGSAGIRRTLPVKPIDGAWLKAKGIDPETCDHPALHES